MGRKFINKTLLLKISLFAFVGLNGIGYISAYLFTNYQSSDRLRIGISRSQNYNDPSDFQLSYTNHKIMIDRGEWLDSWLIKAPHKQPQGTVILFHGKDNNKSSLLDAASILYRMNYNTLLVDFRGSGQSSGNKTTIGVEEGKDVVAAVNYVAKLETAKPIVLYGISMGSAAILKAIADKQIKPDAIILELPFTSLLTAVRTRLRNHGLFPSPMAESIVFWGGIQHGFNGFAHNPLEYAAQVECPTLILAGERDRTVKISELQDLANNLQISPELVIFPQAGHEILARNNPQLWTKVVGKFLSSVGD